MGKDDPAVARRADEFASYCCELLGAVGPCRARRMFGGHGIYTDGVMFGLIAGGQLYLKVDAVTIGQWRAAGGAPFTYDGRGKPIQMSYWTPPDAAMESPGLMAPWARLALTAALRSGQPSRRARREAAPGRQPAAQPQLVTVRPRTSAAAKPAPADASPPARRAAAANARPSGARKPPSAARRSSRS